MYLGNSMHIYFIYICHVCVEIAKACIFLKGLGLLAKSFFSCQTLGLTGIRVHVSPTFLYKFNKDFEFLCFKQT
jgi:hypothetical protein